MCLLSLPENLLSPPLVGRVKRVSLELNLDNRRVRILSGLKLLFNILMGLLSPIVTVSPYIPCTVSELFTTKGKRKVS